MPSTILMLLGRILTILPSYKWKCVKVKVFYADLLRTHLKTHSEKSQINVTSNMMAHLKMHSGEESNNSQYFTCRITQYFIIAQLVKVVNRVLKMYVQKVDKSRQFFSHSINPPSYICCMFWVSYDPYFLQIKNLMMLKWDIWAKLLQMFKKGWSRPHSGLIFGMMKI